MTSAGKRRGEGSPGFRSSAVKRAVSKAVSPARVAAFEVLALVGANKGHSDDLLHSRHTAALSAEDRNLATALVLGVLRWQIALDARIQPLLQRPDQRIADPIAIALRMGAFQLLHLDRIPAHAALSESVELCRVSGHPHATGMVNAILRKIASAPEPGRPIRESTAAFARRLGHPEWMVERWVAAYGRNVALRICEADQCEPSGPRLFEAGEGGGDELPMIDDGSRLVAEIAAALSPNAARVWDACAAPGGKSLILAHRLPKASVLATDVSARRLDAMRSRMERYPYAAKVRAEVADATNPPKELGSFDFILCDVPCTGTGTLSRNPEIRHRLVPEDLQRHSARQRQILRSALDHLADGGRLVYSTCSLEAEECEQVVEAVASEAAASVISIQPILGRLETSRIHGNLLDGAVRGNFLRTLPGTHPGDGFFAAVLERRS